MNPEYAKLYCALYQHHWWWRAREIRLIREIARLRPSAGWGAILDVGCGDGLFFDELARFGDVWGVESDASLVPAESRHQPRIHIGSFDARFQPDRRFGLILLLDVLEHLQDPVTALRHAASLLRQGGRVLITVPAFKELWTYHDDLNQHVVRYRKHALRSVAEEAGLSVLSARYFMHWLVAAKLVVRAAEKLQLSQPHPASIPRGSLNALLFRLTRLEDVALGWADLPFGSSLLAWCGRRSELV